MIIDAAQLSRNRQFILISPQDLRFFFPYLKQS